MQRSKQVLLLRVTIVKLGLWLFWLLMLLVLVLLLHRWPRAVFGVCISGV